MTTCRQSLVDLFGVLDVEVQALLQISVGHTSHSLQTLLDRPESLIIAGEHEQVAVLDAHFFQFFVELVVLVGSRLIMGSSAIASKQVLHAVEGKGLVVDVVGSIFSLLQDSVCHLSRGQRGAATSRALLPLLDQAAIFSARRAALDLVAFGTRDTTMAVTPAAGLERHVEVLFAHG